ncbi:MAG: hypothetical protein AB1489_09270 [Acidobacteriota bacterium]
MKKVLFNLMLLVALVLCVSVGHADAQQKSLKGKWQFILNIPAGPLPVQVSFKSKGKGTVDVPGFGTLSLAYRERGTTFSVSLEGPGFAPGGEDISIVIRGTKTDNNTITGTAIFIASGPDPTMCNSCTGFRTVLIPTTGTRKMSVADQATEQEGN